MLTQMKNVEKIFPMKDSGYESPYLGEQCYCYYFTVTVFTGSVCPLKLRRFSLIFVKRNFEFTVEEVGPMVKSLDRCPLFLHMRDD